MSDRRDAPDDQRAPPPQPTSATGTDDEINGILKATQLNFVLPEILGFLNRQSDITNLKRSSSIVNRRVTEDLPDVNWGRGGELFKIQPKDLEKWIDQYTRLDGRGERVGAKALWIKVPLKRIFGPYLDKFEYRDTYVKNLAIILRVLPQLTQLKYLSLRDSFTHPVEFSHTGQVLLILTAIGQLRHLETLDLSDNYINNSNNNETENNAAALATTIASLPRLQHLSLEHCEFLTGLDKIMNALGKRKHPQTLIKTLHVYVTSNSRTRRDLLDPLALGGFRDLRRFDYNIKSMYSGLDGISNRRLMYAFAKYCPRLTVLHLNNCSFEGDRAVIRREIGERPEPDLLDLYPFLLEDFNRNLTDFDQDKEAFNYFENISASQALFQLCSQTNLRSLQLHSCHLSLESVKDLGTSNAFRNLRDLDIYELRCDQDSAARLIRGCDRLRSLKLANLKTDIAGGIEIQGFNDEEASVFFQALPSSLETLELSIFGRFFTHVGVSRLRAELPRLANLRRLELIDLLYVLQPGKLDLDNIQPRFEYSWRVEEFKLLVQELNSLREYLIDHNISYNLDLDKDIDWRFFPKDEDALQGGAKVRQATKRRSKSRKSKRRSRSKRSLRGGSRLRVFKRFAPEAEDLTLKELARSAIEAFKVKDYDDYTRFRLKAESMYGKEALLQELEIQLKKQIPYTSGNGK